jgi:hypothetical protein
MKKSGPGAPKDAPGPNLNPTPVTLGRSLTALPTLAIIYAHRPDANQERYVYSYPIVISVPPLVKPLAAFLQSANPFSLAVKTIGETLTTSGKRAVGNDF